MQETVGVVGLGYVGTPLAAVLADAGLEVVALDRDSSRVEDVGAGRVPFPGHEPDLAELLLRTRIRTTTAFVDLARASIVLICVDTPLGPRRVPLYESLRQVLARLGPILAHGALVIVESTVAPGTMRDVVIPALEAATGGELGTRFHVGHCPERVASGRLVRNLRIMPRVCGGSTPDVAARMIAFYSQFVEGELDAADLQTAELVKTAENAYRDVQLAFANELAVLCEGAGGDFVRVRQLVNKSPGRAVLWAGPGVGGHCIPKDTWLLAAGAPAVEPWLLAAARRRNDAMPAHVLGRMTAALGSLRGTRLLALGLGYREDSGDLRASPSTQVVELARAAGAEVRVHDPFVAPGDLVLLAQEADALVVLVAHTAYRALPFEALASTMRRKVLIDARQGVSDASAAMAGFHVSRIGLKPAP